MAEFKEELVINVLHPEKAEVGKKYWFADSILSLKRMVEKNDMEPVGELRNISDDTDIHIFLKNRGYGWGLIYPYEEQEQRMTPRMLSEWVAKGNGQWKHKQELSIYSAYTYPEYQDEIDKNIVIRSWDSEEWQEPLYSIYKRDVLGEKED